MKFLTNIDLSRNELQNARVQNLAVDPPNPEVGQIYYNTTTNRLLIYNGTIWVDATSQGTITSVAANAPVSVSVNAGVATVGMPAASNVANGHLTAADWITFNAKEPPIAKNNAFNTSFGTAAGTTAVGNDGRFPTTDEKLALAGTHGTPNNTNRFVTNSDTRLTNSRTPTAHSSTHATGGTDPLTPAAIGAQPALGFTAENIANKGQANGYAGLDANGRVPETQLPPALLAGGGGLWSAVHSVTLGAQSNVVDIGMPLFNPNIDTLLVYQNSAFAQRGQVYTVNALGTQIIRVAAGLWDAGTIFEFVLLKNVADVTVEYDGSLIRNGTVTLNKLTNINTQTILGRNTAGTGTPEVLTPATVKTMLSLVSADVGLGNVTNHAQVRKLASNTSGNIPIWSGTTGDTLADGFAVDTSALSMGTATIPTSNVVRTYVDALLGANDAMVFRGTVGVGGTFTLAAFNALATYNAGWAYKVITAGTYRNRVCEIGDMLIAIVDRGGSGAVDADWTAIQTNIDGAVTGPAAVTANRIAVFNGTTGRLLSEGTRTIADLQEFIPVGTTAQYYRGDKTWQALNWTAIADRPAAFIPASHSLNSHSGILPVNMGGTGQTSYTNGQLLIGNTTGNTLTPATLTAGTDISIINGAGSITINTTGPRRQTHVIGNAALQVFNLTHNWNRRDLSVSIRETATPHELVIADVFFTDLNTIAVHFSRPPSLNQYTVTIIG